MKLAIVNLLLVTCAILMLLFVFRHGASMSFIWPVFQLIRENIFTVVAGVLILIGVLIIYHSPQVRAR